LSPAPGGGYLVFPSNLNPSGSEDTESVGGANAESWVTSVVSPYSTMAQYSAGVSSAHAFVYRTAGKAAYSRLLDAGFLSMPSWSVRFAQHGALSVVDTIIVCEDGVCRSTLVLEPSIRVIQQHVYP
jgi:hypothetical protein